MAKTKYQPIVIRRCNRNLGQTCDTIKTNSQVKKISNLFIVKSSLPTDNLDIPPTKTNFSGMKISDSDLDIHPPLNSLQGGHQRVYSAKLPPCLPAQKKLAAIVALTKIIPNPVPYL